MNVCKELFLYSFLMYQKAVNIYIFFLYIFNLFLSFLFRILLLFRFLFILKIYYLPCAFFFLDFGAMSGFPLDLYKKNTISTKREQYKKRVLVFALLFLLLLLLLMLVPADTNSLILIARPTFRTITNIFSEF